MNFYHYTVAKHAKTILETGVIKLEKSRLELIADYQKYGFSAKANVMANTEDWLCVLWLSSNEIWENTVGKGAGYGLNANYEAFGCYRFRVTPEAVKLHKWTEYKYRYPEQAADLASAAKKMNRSNPYEWFFSESPIAINKTNIIAIETYKDGAWKVAPESL